MRCKCVCKSWLSLRTHPSFKIRHVKHQVPCVVLRLNNSGHERLFSFRSSENLFDHITHRFPIKISSSGLWPLVGSQNGVICLSCSSDRSVYLWNPTIKKLKKLPPYHSNILPTLIHGFGCENNDFKVVKVVGGRLESCNQVGVYSLGTNSWKTINMRPDHIVSDDPDVTIFPHHMHSVDVNGFIHWILNYGRNTVLEVLPLEHSLGILAFDLRTEVLKLIDSPAPSIKPFDVESMCNWSGCLSLVTIYRP
ncbi:Galactose oxidase/kelch, beta-propeller [Parasponia andersonii]|uniref:Galactose oxidase/kelch, beta-propeller n=1 Tax=Parasponia andersonii TaxID=3476 RepID=A0A2P5DVD7_PARAD|nr:Galactose oxidase/kelch, beta-propeller [Parasponia andersonii]